MFGSIKETIGWRDLISIELEKASPAEVIIEVSSGG